MSNYIIVTQEFVDQNQGAQNDCNVLNCVQTLSGQWVCSENTKEEFPELFDGSEAIVQIERELFITE